MKLYRCILYMLILTLLGASAGGCSILNSFSCTAESTDGNQLGAVQKSGNASFVVLGWQVADKLVYPPASGQQNLLVDVILVNTGSYPVILSSLRLVWLEDNDRNRYDPQIGWDMTNRLDGKLLPNEKVGARLGFSVPDPVCRPRLNLDASGLEGTIVSVYLGQTAKTIKTPDAIEKIPIPKTVVDGKRIWFGQLGVTATLQPSPKMAAFLGKGKSDMIIIQLFFENFGKQEILVNTMDQFYLVDSSGKRYPPDVKTTAQIDGKLVSGTIQPRYTVDSTVAFRMPYHAGDISLVYDPEPRQLMKGKTFIFLGTPVSQ